MKLIRLMLLALVPALAFTIAGCSDSSTTADIGTTPTDMAVAPVQDLAHVNHGG